MIDVQNNSIIHSMESLESYAKDISSSLYLLETFGVNHTATDHAASHWQSDQDFKSASWNTLSHQSTFYLYIPLSAKHKFSEESLYQGECDPNDLADIIFEMASMANAHLAKAQKLSG
eukprot:TRINITY_DN1859_c0_g1_i3.p1 TRINITY_DN1859_c0_g1~~TRINITY_DN1859_c0_g1_i3.p1  ORF type:complete len:118 (+),score=13.29 TRINITY_DN1859_c0_g1_i3:215-568(+)